MRFSSITALKLFLLHLFTLFTNLQAYTPVNNFTINCGSTGTSYDGETTWTGDTASMFLSHQDSTVSANPTPPQSNSTLQLPYTTARISRSQFNYSFPVTPGSYFLRLFFYPASYPSFPSTQASFTVHCNHFTLFYGFSTDEDDTETIFREYVVNVDNGETLNLSFTPSQPNSHALINGIQVFSIPTDLYYTSPHHAGFKLVGTHTLYRVTSDTALHAQYRVKVGVQGISPPKDTGLFRNLVAGDEHYLIKEKNPNNNGEMNITLHHGSVAPKVLYRTERITKRSPKLTWNFPVDSGFYYLVRLHFCELDQNITNIGDRVFCVYIGSDLAEDHAEVLRWSNQLKGLAVQRNFVVLIPKNDTQEKVNLSLQLHPYLNSSNPCLNGLEIFKISDSNILAGPNAQNGIAFEERRNGMAVGKRRNVLSVEKRRNKHKISIAGMVFVLVSVSSVGFVFRWARSMFNPRSFSTNAHKLSTNAHQQSTDAEELPVNTLICLRFSLVEIKAATNNFDDASVVGVGGFGHVYRGFIRRIFIPVTLKLFKPGSNEIEVAIKRHKPGSKQGSEEFLNEIEMLSQLRHRNIVPLIGYCNSNKEMILVYNFMARGNLREHLYNSDKPPLPWKRRLQICIDAAHALHYLHCCAQTYTIIHSDVKTTNILLDEEWVAKVSDFGLSRIGPTGDSKSNVCTTPVKGSFGYIDPEYYKRQHLTEKSDVYSFGVVLFEVLCARPPLIRTAEPREESLGNWVRYCHQNGTIAQILDPTLKGKIAPNCFRVFCQIGLSCLSEIGSQRPSMNDVVWMLKNALKLQESADITEAHSNSQNPLSS